MKVTLQESNFQEIQEGEVLKAEVSAVAEKVMPYTDDDGKQVTKVEFEFSITDELNTGRRLWGNTPTTFTDSPQCKLRSWVQEILGVDVLPSGFALDTDDLVGRSCRVQIRHRESKKTGKVYEYVADVIRNRRPIARAVPEQPVVEQYTEEPF